MEFVKDKALENKFYYIHLNETINQNTMEKNLYIDASHPNETRVVLKSNNNIEDYEYEGIKNNLIKNNIYLGKVSG